MWSHLEGSWPIECYLTYLKWWYPLQVIRPWLGDPQFGEVPNWPQILWLVVLFVWTDQPIYSSWFLTCWMLLGIFQSQSWRIIAHYRVKICRFARDVPSDQPRRLGTPRTSHGGLVRWENQKKPSNCCWQMFHCHVTRGKSWVLDRFAPSNLDRQTEFGDDEIITLFVKIMSFGNCAKNDLWLWRNGVINDV